MDTRSHTLLDGTQLVFEGDLPLAERATSIGTLQLPGNVCNFVVGDLQFGRDVADVFGISDFEQYSFQGGSLLIGHGYTVDPITSQPASTIQIGRWEGEVWSVRTELYGATSEDLIRLFAQVTIEELPRGVILSPAAEGVRILEDFRTVPRVLREVTDLGLVRTSPLVQEMSRFIPAHGGAAVSGGELYKADGGEPEGDYFVLVGPSSYSRIHPFWESLTEAQVLDGLGRLNVTTTAA